jgi:anti-sigma B factor antagonist
VSVERWPVKWTGERAIVTFPAEVDANNAHIARNRLIAVIEQDGAKVVVADMMGTTFCDSAGVTALAAARRKAVSHGAAFSLACSSPQILRILELTGLDQMLPLFASVDEAIA